jgi:hypothetical protein
MIAASVHFPDQLGLFAYGLAISGQYQGADDGIKKSTQLNDARLDSRRELTQSNCERICGLRMSGTETFGKQQNSFFTHKK